MCRVLLMWKHIPAPLSRWPPPTVLVPGSLSEGTPKESGTENVLLASKDSKQVEEPGQPNGVHGVHSCSPRPYPSPQSPTLSSAPDLPRTQSQRLEQAPQNAPKTAFTGPTPGTLGHSQLRCFLSTDIENSALWPSAYALQSLGLRGSVCYVAKAAKGVTA